ncbi:hypothetical protein Tco_0213487 [Tanacetum coccineum]
MTTASLKRRSRLIGVTNKEVAFQLLKQKFGHVLCKGKGISYALRQLKIHNKNYTTQSGTMEQRNMNKRQRPMDKLHSDNVIAKIRYQPREENCRFAELCAGKNGNHRKCHADEPLAILLDGLHFDDKLQFVEEPIEIIDREVNRLKQSHIPLVKVRWNSKKGPEFTWEREDQFRKKYPHLFSKTGSSSSVTCVLKPEDRVVGELGWEVSYGQAQLTDGGGVGDP